MEKKKSHKLVAYLSFLLVTTFPFFINNALAETLVDSCKQIMVVGDVNWPPYAMQEEDAAGNAVINGIGIELVQQIFAELDIPVQIVKLDNRRNILNGLHLGDIDILVSTYTNKDIEEVVDIIKPGYVLDPVAVYMRKGETVGINRWDDLIGKRGVMSDYFLFDSSFEDYVNRYLYIHAKGDLGSVIDLVNDRKADYIIGSRLQLERGIKQAALEEGLELLTTVSHADEVHMGYSKTSLCRAYLPYLRKRLMDLKEDGTVNEIVTRYLAKDNLAKTEQDNNEEIITPDDIIKLPELPAIESDVVEPNPAPVQDGKIEALPQSTYPKESSKL